MKKVLMFLADGFEEIEALATADVLRRGGMDVTLASIKDKYEVTGANGITVKADVLLADIDTQTRYDWLVCPGGMPGASNLASSTQVCEMLKSQFAEGGNIAAICAAPAVVLAPLGLLADKKATCYPGFEASLPEIMFTGAGVQSDGNIITGRGPGFAIDFALAILSQAVGSETAQTVGAGLLVR